MDCLFCQQEKRVVYKTQNIYVVEDKFPVTKGHSLVIPKQHVKDWFALSKGLQYEMMDVVNAMKLIIDVKYAPDGYNIGINCGVAAGQSIFHLHLHIIPRYQNDMENPLGGVRGVIPEKRIYNAP